MPVIHSSYLEPGHRYWSMHRPDELSEAIVLAERQRSYLRTSDAVPIAAPKKMIQTESEPDEAFDSLYHQHHGWISGWAARFFKFSDPNGVDDAAQEVWEKVVLHIRKFAGTASDRNYLSCIAHNTFCERYNGWQTAAIKRQRALSVIPQGIEESDKVSPLASSSYQACADDQPLFSVLHAGELADAMTGLNEVEFKVVTDYFGGLSFAAISSKHRLSSTWTSKVYQNAARKIATSIRIRHGIDDAEFSISSNVRGLIPDGSKFGYLTVLNFAGTSNRNQFEYHCRCSLDSCTHVILLSAGQLNDGRKNCSHHGKTGHRYV